MLYFIFNREDCTSQKPSMLLQLVHSSYVTCSKDCGCNHLVTSCGRSSKVKVLCCVGVAPECFLFVFPSWTPSLSLRQRGRSFQQLPWAGGVTTERLHLITMHGANPWICTIDLVIIFTFIERLWGALLGWSVPVSQQPLHLAEVAVWRPRGLQDGRGWEKLPGNRCTSEILIKHYYSPVMKATPCQSQYRREAGESL